MGNAFRVHQLARELGLTSAAIIKKCSEKRVPKEVVCTHMSPLSREMELRIRQWFRKDDDGADGLAGVGAKL